MSKRHVFSLGRIELRPVTHHPLRHVYADAQKPLKRVSFWRTTRSAHLRVINVWWRTKPTSWRELQ